MKKSSIIAATIALTGLFGNASAMADEYTACTKDRKTAKINLDIGDGLKEGVDAKSVVQTAWEMTVKSLDSQELLSQQGLTLFRLNMQTAVSKIETDISSQDDSPVIGEPACTPKP